MSASSASAAIPVSMNAPRELRAAARARPADGSTRPQAGGRTGSSSTRRCSSPCSCWRLLLGILLALGYAAIPAFEKFGLAFFLTNVWNPVKSEFGALAPIYGTLVTSLIALLIGVPVSFGIALFLTEMCPAALQASARHGGRAAGGHSVDHLRHVGTLRLRAALRRLHPAGC